MGSISGHHIGELTNITMDVYTTVTHFITVYSVNDRHTLQFHHQNAHLSQQWLCVIIIYNNHIFMTTQENC